MALVDDIDRLSNAISHATAPAFMLGAVAAFLSILIARTKRIADRKRALRRATPCIFGSIDKAAFRRLNDRAHKKVFGRQN